MNSNELLLPHFIVIGAMKSGTTTLYRYLSAHPDIDMSRDKETDFFVAEKNWDEGFEWYSNQFAGPGSVRGEASPNYTKARDFPGVPERISQVCPNAKFIYVVRDPVERAVSQYKHSFILGLIDGNLEAFESSHEYAHILDASCYAKQLAEFRKYFESEAILILDFDELVKDPQKVMEAVFAHIGVRSIPIMDDGAKNDSQQLAKVPAPILRFVQSATGKRLARTISRETRDKIRNALARGRTRVSPEFPPNLLEQIKTDLKMDSTEFRRATGMKFSSWSL